MKALRAYENVGITERFWSYVGRKSEGCWPWLASLKDGGYGQLMVKGRPMLAHRLAVILSGRTIPPEMHVDHICRNRRCVRPSHLEVVTPTENCMARGVSPKARVYQTGVCLRGHDKNGKYNCPACEKLNKARLREKKKGVMA